MEKMIKIALAMIITLVVIPNNVRAISVYNSSIYPINIQVVGRTSDGLDVAIDEQSLESNTQYKITNSTETLKYKSDFYIKHGNKYLKINGNDKQIILTENRSQAAIFTAERAKDTSQTGTVSFDSDNFVYLKTNNGYLRAASGWNTDYSTSTSQRDRIKWYFDNGTNDGALQPNANYQTAYYTINDVKIKAKFDNKTWRLLVENNGLKHSDTKSSNFQIEFIVTNPHCTVTQRNTTFTGLNDRTRVNIRGTSVEIFTNTVRISGHNKGESVGYSNTFRIIQDGQTWKRQ